MGLPFLAMSGRHGGAASFEKLQGGIGILLDNLNSVGIGADNNTARIGGGALAKDVVDALWKVDKQTGTWVNLRLNCIGSNERSHWSM